VVLMAKEPRAGYAKTRLAPAVGAAGAAQVAAALLADAVSAVSGCSAERRVTAYSGAAGPWLPAGIPAIAQRGADLGERLANVVRDVQAPLLIVAADSPEMRPASIDEALGLLITSHYDAVIGRARDGGYWCIGLVAPHPEVFEGVPMSVPGTAQAQVDRLTELGLSSAEAELFWDVDDEASAEAAARACPRSAFAITWEPLAAARERRVPEGGNLLS
jgi:rSAM/selenodomain-associated transferase 1